MLASTIDIGFPPGWHSTVMQIQEKVKANANPPASLQVRSAYFIGNSITIARSGREHEAAPVTDSVSRDYRPRTPLGEKLLALRRAYISQGGRLLDADQLDHEMRMRRGGVANA